MDGLYANRFPGGRVVGLAPASLRSRFGALPATDEPTELVDSVSDVAEFAPSKLKGAGAYVSFCIV